MIQERHDIAWVRGGDGRLTPFDAARLTDSLQQAAAIAGHTDSLLAESVASAVYLFARDGTPDATIDVAEIAEIVLAVLSMLDSKDIARAYAQRRQWAEIRLDRMAASTQTGFELEFYHRLDRELRTLTDEELELVQLRGLRSCVMQLQGAQRWGLACRSLADDIVGFVRGRVLQVRQAYTTALSLEVLE